MKRSYNPSHHIFFLVLVTVLFYFHHPIVNAQNQIPDSWKEYLTKPNAQEAKFRFESELKTNPTNPLIWYGLSITEKSLGNPSKAFHAMVNALDKGRYEPDAEIYLSKAFELNPYTHNPQTLIKICESITKDPKCSKYFQSVVHWYLSFLYRQAGQLTMAKSEIEKLGFITDYMVIGPFDNEGKIGFDTVYPPENEFILDTIYSGKLVDAKWYQPNAKPDWGIISLDALLNPQDKVTGYILTFVYSPQSQWSALRIGGSALKVWVNNEFILSNPANRRGKFDQEHKAVFLHEGWNKILVKSGIQSGPWDIYFRITNPDGEPLNGLKYSVEKTVINEYSNSNKSINIEKPEKIPIQIGSIYYLEKQYRDKPEDVLSIANLAYLYTSRYIHDEHSQENIVVIEKALSQYPASTYLKKTYADCQSDDNLRRQYLESAQESDTEDIELLNWLAEIDSKAGLSEEAIEKLKLAIEKNPNYGIAYYNLGIETRNKGWSEEANTYFSNVTQQQPYLAESYYQLANLSLVTRTMEQKIDLLNKCLSVNYLHLSSYDQLAEIYLYKGNNDDFLNRINQKKELNPFDLSVYQKLGNTEFHQNHLDKAMDYVDSALSISPYDYRILRLKGLIYHKKGELEKAKESWNLALKAKPNDNWLTEYLAFLAPESEKYYYPYRVTFEQVLTYNLDSIDLTQSNVVNLLDQDINRVYDDGNASRYKHMIAKVLNDDGAKQLAYQSIGYSPNRQKVELIKCRIIKPDGTIIDGKEAGEFSASNVGARLYYDYKVKQYSFPGLEKDAYVEFEYKIDDTQNNLYADYFGDIFMVGNYDPTIKSEYILMKPKTRNIQYFMDKITKAPVIENSGDESIETLIWRFSDLNFIEREPYMPSASETLPYIKLSSFTKWDDVAKWYWNLIQDQFTAPQDLRDFVQELTKDKKTNMEKVRALYDFTVTDVRYLGLEFGAGGYKPHKSLEVFRSRYGDCKDKATLLITMLNEIGIPADIVLIRTKDLGAVDYTLPSLGLFNHAIVHIPDVDGISLWLDGTAMFTSLDEFPAGDQNRQVFCINSSKGYFAITTSYSSQQTLASYKNEINLFPEGNAKGKRTTKVAGQFAPSMRYYFSNPSKIKQDVERQFNSLYTGTSIDSVIHSDFTNLNESPELQIEFSSPQIGTKSGNSFQLVGNLFPSRLTDYYARRSRRIHPIKFPYPWTRTFSTIYNLPDGYSVDYLPENIVKEYPFGRLSVNYSKNNNQIIFNEEIELKLWELNPEQYPDFREWCNLVDRKEEEKIIISVKK